MLSQYLQGKVIKMCIFCRTAEIKRSGSVDISNNVGQSHMQTEMDK